MAQRPFCAPISADTRLKSCKAFRCTTDRHPYFHVGWPKNRKTEQGLGILTAIRFTRTAPFDPLMTSAALWNGKAPGLAAEPGHPCPGPPSGGRAQTANCSPGHGVPAVRLSPSCRLMPSTRHRQPQENPQAFDQARPCAPLIWTIVTTLEAFFLRDAVPPRLFQMRPKT